MEWQATKLNNKGWSIGLGPNFAFFEARKLNMAYRFEQEGGSIVAFKAIGNGWERLKSLPQL